MIDLSLTDEQKSLRELAHEFAEKEIRPVAWEYDRESTWPRAIRWSPWASCWSWPSSSLPSSSASGSTTPR